MKLSAVTLILLDNSFRYLCKGRASRQAKQGTMVLPLCPIHHAHYS